MTSNIGSQIIQRITSEGGDENDIREAIQETLKTRFLPELLNRIDDKIVFRPLERDQIRKIVDLQIKDLAARLADQELQLDVSDAAKDQIAEEGFDPQYGARPLKRVIQTRLANPLATELLRQNLEPGTTLRVDFKDGEFEISN
jgi:ATP-dependent Clp protease ATP-binding subunit ClpB